MREFLDWADRRANRRRLAPSGPPFRPCVRWEGYRAEGDLRVQPVAVGAESKRTERTIVARRAVVECTLVDRGVRLVGIALQPSAPTCVRATHPKGSWR